MCRQLLAVLLAEEDRVRIGLFQRDPRRAVADDHLGAGQIEIEERLEILLHRDPADREKHRRRQAEVDRAGMEQMGVDAARPQHDIVEAALGKLAGERRRCRHHGAAGRCGIGAAPARSGIPEPARGRGHIRESGCGSWS